MRFIVTRKFIFSSTFCFLLADFQPFMMLSRLDSSIRNLLIPLRGEARSHLSISQKAPTPINHKVGRQTLALGVSVSLWFGELVIRDKQERAFLCSKTEGFFVKMRLRSFEVSEALEKNLQQLFLKKSSGSEVKLCDEISFLSPATTTTSRESKQTKFFLANSTTCSTSVTE